MDELEDKMALKLMPEAVVASSSMANCMRVSGTSHRIKCKHCCRPKLANELKKLKYCCRYLEVCSVMKSRLVSMESTVWMMESLCNTL